MKRGDGGESIYGAVFEGKHICWSIISDMYHVYKDIMNSLCYLQYNKDYEEFSFCFIGGSKILLISWHLNHCLTSEE